MPNPFHLVDEKFYLVDHQFASICFKIHWKKNFNDTDKIVVPWPILYWRFTVNQGLLVSVQPVCVFQPYELLLQQYFWLTVKYFLSNYLKTFSYIHMADKSQAFLSVFAFIKNIQMILLPRTVLLLLTG